MAQTKAVDLFNPEVLADSIEGKLGNAVRFAPHARIDNTLEGQPGDTITRPKYGYVGPADELVEGVPMDPAKLSMTTSQVTIKEAGKAVEVTEKAIITNLNGTMAEAENQILLSLADKVEIDYVAELDKALLSHAGAPTTAEAIMDAIAQFEDEDDENYILFIHPTDYAELAKSLIDGNTFLSRAQIADLIGVSEIERTRRVAAGTGFVQKQGAVEIVYKKRANVEGDHDILARTFVLAGNQYYTVNLYNDNGVVKIESAG